LDSLWGLERFTHPRSHVNNDNLFENICKYIDFGRLLAVKHRLFDIDQNHGFIFYFNLLTINIRNGINYRFCKEGLKMKKKLLAISMFLTLAVLNNFAMD